MVAGNLNTLLGCACNWFACICAFKWLGSESIRPEILGIYKSQSNFGYDDSNLVQHSTPGAFQM